MKTHVPSSRDEKIEVGKKFIESLDKKFIKFAGITGSVSYTPGEYDDIDIFIITKTGMAWRSMLDALVKRRFLGLRDICLSLIMDEKYAFNYFSKINDALIIQDSIKTIPIYGEHYYRILLRSSPAISERLGEKNNTTNDLLIEYNRGIFNISIFLLLSPFLRIKAIYNNWKEKKNSGGFDIHIAVDSYYLDSYKYKMLRQKFREEGSDNAIVLYNNS